jgi:biotin carboxyl carrier protein
MEVIAGMAGPSPLKIGGEVRTLEWRAGGTPDRAIVRLDEKEYDIRYRFVDDGQVLLQANGRRVRAFLAGNHEGRYVFIAGQVYRVEALGLSRIRRDRTVSAEEPGEVTPPMPAVVVRLLVREGETVVKGQGLVVVSAMKMETTLKAPLEGVVRKINTALQAKVMPGDRLVEIDKKVQS